MSTSNQHISVSSLAETKMALHSAKHGLSNPIHGIVIGKRSGDDNNVLEIVDAIPVCHEVPTKPIVDMALRLVDAHLQQQGGDDLTIIGWYTSNASTLDDDTPNLSACRIASSMSDNCQDGGDNFILVLVTTSGLLAAVSKDSDSSLSLCRVFQKDTKTKTFSSEVNSSFVTQENDTSYIISKALSKEMPIYDFVDHISNYGSEDWNNMDWIKNGAIKL
ncbi:MPN domain-containing protein [Skeletonema marinoi]|uniref:MPN domain-containing protein n=1 Tax=Skeletonema marinoi TaxID=267567 RepID=A0AAD9DKI0_9STRA|nr:MPN domain-containing protein [Skeletonema marinoi]